MDTNQIAVLIDALAGKGSAAIAWDKLILAIAISAVPAVVAAIVSMIGMKHSKAANTKADKTAEVANTKADKSAEVMDKVHIAVNSERKAMQETLKLLNEKILELSKQNATFQEHLRGEQQAKETATAVAVAKQEGANV